MTPMVRADRPPNKRFAQKRIFECMTSLVPDGPADLLAVRFAWSPLWETLHAVRTLVGRKAYPYHAAWHGVVADEVARLDLAALLAITPPRGYTPDFLTP